MQGVSTTDTIADCDEYVNTPTSYHLYRLLHRLALHVSTLPIPSLWLWVRLLLVWKTVPSFLSVVLCFTNFVILCTPSLLPPFGGYQHYYGYIRPCYWFVKVYYILRVLRLMISPLCFSYVLVFLQTSLPIQHTQPVQVLQFRLCACL